MKHGDQYYQGKIYRPMAATLQELEDQAERVFMDLNNNRASMLRKAAYSIKRRGG